MQIEEFTLERIQSLFENVVDYNLSDSGVHPYSLGELLSPDERERVLATELGYGWTNGAVPLREAIAAIYANRGADEVIVTNGSAEANFLTAMTLLEPGDEIIVVVPNYLQIRGWAKAMGVTVRDVPLRQELGWLPDPADIRAALTPRTRVITLCTPNNPTGRVIPGELLGEIVAIARKHGVWLHTDEVYKGAEYGTVEPPSSVDLYEKAIVTNGLSKAMALPGLRIGWLIGPAAEIYRAWQRKDYTSITTSAVSEVVARMVLEPARRKAILDRSRDLLSRNVELMVRWVRANEGIVSLAPPQAGGMAFVRCHLPINSTELAHRLKDEQSVLVAPGDVYGMDGYFRVGIGAPAHVLEAGLDRVQTFLRGLARTAA
jgi:aspartate/methionine/tyrosine aminotransferase